MVTTTATALRQPCAERRRGSGAVVVQAASRSETGTSFQIPSIVGHTIFSVHDVVGVLFKVERPDILRRAAYNGRTARSP
jgi:hypothetical protein